MPLQRIAIVGSSGRMGRSLLETTLKTPECELAAAIVRQGSPWVGKEVSALIGGYTPLILTDELSISQKIDCLIDFTRPESTLHYLTWCCEHQVNMVIGTTGFTDEEKSLLKVASQKIAIVFAPNMSVGVNVVLKLLSMTAKLLSEDYDIEIVEMHHRHKVDAPSGTAKQMGEVIADTLGRNLNDSVVYGREGITGQRDPRTIGFSTMRGGDVVGDHTVVFAGIGERIEISHKASSRQAFSQGALRAARFLLDKRTGLYDMSDVLALTT